MSAATHKQTYERANPSVHLSEAPAAAEAQEWRPVGSGRSSARKEEEHTTSNEKRPEAPFGPNVSLFDASNFKRFRFRQPME